MKKSVPANNIEKRLLKKTSFLLISLMCLIILSSLSFASLPDSSLCSNDPNDYILYDDFESGSIDTTLWDNTNVKGSIQSTYKAEGTYSLKCLGDNTGVSCLNSKYGIASNDMVTAYYMSRKYYNQPSTQHSGYLPHYETQSGHFMTFWKNEGGSLANNYDYYDGTWSTYGLAKPSSETDFHYIKFWEQANTQISVNITTSTQSILETDVNTPITDGDKFFTYTNLQYSLDTYFDKIMIWNKTLYGLDCPPVTASVDYFEITASNLWNGSQIDSFFAYVNGDYLTTTNGTITTSYNLTSASNVNLTIGKYQYLNYTALNFLANESLEVSLFQSETRIKASEIYTDNFINNFSVITENGVSSTTNGTIILYPNLDTYSWNFTADNYFNVTDLEFPVIPVEVIIPSNETFTSQSVEIGNPNINFTITNIYSNYFHFKDSVSNATINPNCEYEIINLSSDPYKIAGLSTNNTMNCSIFGYNSQLITLNNSFPNEESFYLVPVELLINFSSQTSGYIAWEDPINGSAGFTFNDTSILLLQREIGTGDVTIVFNDGQQLFEYYNDENTNINQYLYVTEPDLIQPVKIWDGSIGLAGRITTQMLIDEEWVTIYSTYTDLQGEANILVKDGNSFKFIAQVDNYNAGTQIEFIEPTTETISSDVILLLVTEETLSSNSLVLESSCFRTIDTPNSCTLIATSSSQAYNFLFKWNDSVSSGEFSTSDTSTATFPTYVFNETIVDIYVDGTYKRSYTIEVLNKSLLDKQIGFKTEDTNWIYTGYNLIWFIAFTIIFSVVVGGLVENKVKGWGLNSAIAYITMNGFIFPVFFAVGLIAFAWYLYGSFSGGNK